MTYTSPANYPSIRGASITDMDDTSNVYAMRKYYSFVAEVADPDADVAKVYLRAKNGTDSSSRSARTH